MPPPRLELERLETVRPKLADNALQTGQVSDGEASDLTRQRPISLTRLHRPHLLQ